MSDKERLKDILMGVNAYMLENIEDYADALAGYLLENGVLVLPCKVGDALYKVWHEPCNNGVTFPDGIDCDGCYDECDIKKSLTEVKIPNIQFIIEQFILKDNNFVYFIPKKRRFKVFGKRK